MENLKQFDIIINSVNSITIWALFTLNANYSFLSNYNPHNSWKYQTNTYPVSSLNVLYCA